MVTDHEDVHVWQGRWFGPLYPFLYGGWMLLGGAVGAVVWAVRRRDQPIGGVNTRYKGGAFVPPPDQRGT